MGSFIHCPKCGSPIHVMDIVKDEYECTNCGWNNYKKRLLDYKEIFNVPKSEKPEMPENMIYDSLADKCRRMFTKFRDRGFSEDQAFVLTCELIKIAIRENDKKENVIKDKKLRKERLKNIRRYNKDPIEEVNDLNRKREDEAWKRARANNGL